MKAVNFIIQKHFGEFIKNVFTEQLLSKKDMSENDILSIAEKMKFKFKELNELANINIQDNDIQKAIVDFCEKNKITQKISTNKVIADNIIIDIINDGLDLKSEFFNKLSFNIQEAYKNGFNINRLYQPISIKSELITNKNIINKDIYAFLDITIKSDTKEAIGVINTHLENSQYTHDEIKKMWDNSIKKSPYDENKQNEIFIKEIIKNVNSDSLTSNSFTINNNGNIKFNRKVSGIYDNITYSKKTNSFSLSFSTTKQNINVKNDTMFRHSLSAIATLQCINTWFAENDNYKLNNVDDLKKIINIVSTGFKNEKDFRMAFQENKYETMFEKSINEATTEGVDESIKGINEKINFFLQDLITGFNEKSVNKIKTEKIMDMFDETNKSVDSFFDETNYTHDTLIQINEKNINELINSLKFNLDIFFFGEIKNKRNSKNNSYSENFTDEELISGINILACSGRHLEGFDGIRLSPKASVAFLEKMNYRFNTSTEHKYNCIDLNKTNSNIREIGGVIIDEFIANNDIEKVKKTNPNESDTILKNISLFEKNVLSQILEVMKESYCTPEKAYKSVIKSFKSNLELDLESFLDVVSEKLKSIPNEKYSFGNNFIIDGIKHKIGLHQNELGNKNNNELQKLKDSLKQNDIKFQ
jgi:hypothetical protein